MLPTLCLALAVVAMVLVLRRLAPRLPGALFAVVAAIAASAAFDFSGHGIAVIEKVTGGLPPIGLPDVSWGEIRPLLPVAGSCFLMIVAQSAATARAYASRHREILDENTDLVGLSAANAAAALSGTFVVNGSPTQTAMVESSGGRSQIAHLATAAVVAFVLLFLTGPLHYLPRCVLGAIVFTIAVGLVDVRGLRDILRESPGEFRLALITAAVVVLIGVEQGILLAIVLSLLRHVRHSYRPHTAVLVEKDGQWRPIPAVPGAVSGPGLVVFQFGADLFYANASRFAADVRGLVEGASPPVKWLVVDAGAITSVDYSAARVLRDLQRDLISRGIAMVLVHAESSLRADLRPASPDGGHRRRSHLRHLARSARRDQCGIAFIPYPPPIPRSCGGSDENRLDKSEGAGHNCSVPARQRYRQWWQEQGGAISTEAGFGPAGRDQEFRKSPCPGRSGLPLMLWIANSAEIVGYHRLDLVYDREPAVRSGQKTDSVAQHGRYDQRIVGKQTIAPL